MDGHEADSIAQTSQTQAMATKTLDIDVDYFRNHNYRLSTGDILPSCAFYSTSQREYIEHFFDIPDIGL